MGPVRNAFTLVEILIVVIILGILAAIVVPQFTSASEDAQISNTETQLSTIRNQIELYRVRNNAQYPDFVGFAGHWGDPSAPPLASGDPDPIAEGLRGGDYLKKPPINPRTRAVAGSEAPAVAGEPLVGGTLILFQVAPTAGDVGGWVWDATLDSEEMYAARFDEVAREWLD